jgi:hypothetical protein
MVNYNASSPYYNTTVENNQFLDVMINRYIPKSVDDAYWEITPAYNLRPDLLAFDLYSDSKLWWVFAQRNPDILVDPLNNFTSGTKIYVPTMTTLKTVLGI